MAKPAEDESGREQPRDGTDPYEPAGEQPVAEFAFVGTQLPADCGPVEGIDLPDLDDEGRSERDDVIVAGRAYYVHQLARDVERAADVLVERVLSGELVPLGTRAQAQICATIKARLTQQDNSGMLALLDAEFADGSIDARIDALVTRLGEFDRVRARAGAGQGSARSDRVALERELIATRRELTRRGTMGLRLVLNPLAERLVVIVGLLQLDTVMAHAGTIRERDTVATMAALTGTEVDELRRRAMKATAVRRFSADLAELDPTDRGHDRLLQLEDDDIIRLGDALAFWPGNGAAPDAAAVEGTADEVADREAELIARRAVLTSFG
jgi:hypothetical protein